MRIQQIMSQPVVTCGPDDTLNTAARLLWEHDVGALPVVGPDGRVIGIVTDRDICMAAYTQGSALASIPVSSAMARQVFSCRPEDAVEAAERLMSEKQVRRVPVVDSEHRPIGMLSLNDVAREAATSTKKNGSDREIVQALASICRPRAKRAESAGASRTTAPI